MIHSPFHVVDNFISALQCETLVKNLGLTCPDVDLNGQPLKYERHIPSELSGNILNGIEEIFPLLERRYSAEISEVNLMFQQYWENPKAPAEQLGCESSKFLRKKWCKVKDIDLVGFIWLKDFHDDVPLDPRIEVYGGKIEFPTYNFSLTPTRGTLVMYPGTPHFITAISHVLLGSLEQIKVTMKLKKDGAAWAYSGADYPGSYQEWFFGEEQ
jgi:hypothetical protein